MTTAEIIAVLDRCFEAVPVKDAQLHWDILHAKDELMQREFSAAPDLTQAHEFCPCAEH